MNRLNDTKAEWFDAEPDPAPPAAPPLAQRLHHEHAERTRQEHWRDRSSQASTFDNWKQYERDPKRR